MELSIQDLLDKINKEGVDEALQKKEQIINKANEDAQKIVKDAKAEADNIVADAKREAEKLVKQGENSLEQDARNIRLSLKNELNDLFASVLNDNIKNNLTPSDYTEIIKAAISGVEDADKKAELSDKLYSGIAASVFSSLGIKAENNPSLRSGFKLSVNNGKAYYDFTDEELTALLVPYLSEGLNRIICKK